MRKISLIATTALLAGGFGVAVAQVAPNNRPMNMGVSPQAMQAAGNTNVYQVQIDQLKAQVNALSGQLTATKTELASVRKDLATVSSVNTQRLNLSEKNFNDLKQRYVFHRHWGSMTSVRLENGVAYPNLPQDELTSFAAEGCTKVKTGNGSNEYRVDCTVVK